MLFLPGILKANITDFYEVYLVIGYYLQHRAEVNAYVQQQRQLADKARRAYEADHPNDPLRERLLADENFHGDVLRGLLRVEPKLDILRVQDSEYYQAADPVVLECAAKEGVSC